MAKQTLWPLLALLLIAAVAAPRNPGQTPLSQPSPPQVKFELLNRQGAPVRALTDGDWVKLTVSRETESPLALAIAFTIGEEARVVARCIIGQGESRCETALAPSLGWFWSKGGKTETERELRVATSDPGIPKELKFSAVMKLRVAPRPVVLVHGFTSTASTWQAYTKADGFLASAGLRGFAVGDGQAEGVMATGDLAQPLRLTNTIAQNAEVLRRYIAGVKKATGAETVDLVAHSMGGLISRYYIDRLMGERDVAQLVMLGSPHGGTGCASLPASLGFYLPATLELRTSYLAEVFNKQITQRRGVPFYLMAGNPIVESFKAPCTDTPSDLVVSRISAGAITAPVADRPILHTEMTGSEAAFREFVLPRLRAAEFPAEPDPPLPVATSSPVQFTKVFTGHVEPGGSTQLTVNLDQVTVAGFALFDPTRSLRVTVRGASGAVIELSAEKNGLIEVRDPATLFTLGYGFQNPAPGPWKINLDATAATPAAGADFALTAKVEGGATLRAQTDRQVVEAGQPVSIQAALESAGGAVRDADIQTTIRRPGSNPVLILMADAKGAEERAVWTPDEPGLYSIDVVATGSDPDGRLLERTVFLAAEVQPDPNRGLLSLSLLAIAVLTLLTGIAFWLKNRFVGKKKRGGLEL
jgi:pimeloyl-ACP methyl ester carboxylesterase